MSASYNVPLPTIGVEAAHGSVDRLERQHEVATRSPSIVNDIMRGLALFAAVGTMVNLSLEIADAIQQKE